MRANTETTKERRSEVIQVAVTPTQRRAIEAVCRRLGSSMSDLGQRAIERFLRDAPGSKGRSGA